VLHDLDDDAFDGCSAAAKRMYARAVTPSPYAASRVTVSNLLNPVRNHPVPSYGLGRSNSLQIYFVEDDNGHDDRDTLDRIVASLPRDTVSKKPPRSRLLLCRNLASRPSANEPYFSLLTTPRAHLNARPISEADPIRDGEEITEHKDDPGFESDHVSEESDQQEEAMDVDTKRGIRDR
jgi:hypothetical protein